MIILLEGFDGSGKSTLNSMLSEFYQNKIKAWHPGAPPKSEDEAIVRCHEQNGLFNVADKINLIMDRTTCISNDAYTLMGSDFDYYHFRHLLSDCQNVLIVYCKTSGLEDQDFIPSEHDVEGSIEHAKNNATEIMKCYDIIMEEFEDGMYFEYDFRDENAFNHLVEYIHKNFKFDI